MNRAVFLDRDGVIVRDADLIIRIEQIEILENITSALYKLKAAGYLLVVVSNQPVIAIGLISEDEVKKINDEIERRIVDLDGPHIDGFYFCPHHPNANVKQYRVVCDCRKPEPGLILKASLDFYIDTGKSYMVGDRITDIAAGKAADCTTIQVMSGLHEAPTIQTAHPIDPTLEPDYACRDLSAATQWILARMALT